MFTLAFADLSGEYFKMITLLAGKSIHRMGRLCFRRPVPLRAESRSLGRGPLLESGNSLMQVCKLIFVGQRSLGKGIQHAFDILPIMRDGVGDLGEIPLGRHAGHGVFQLGKVRLKGGQPGVALGGQPEQFIQRILKTRSVHTEPFSLHNTKIGASQRRMLRWGAVLRVETELRDKN